jgi:hypothetical protein
MTTDGAGKPIPYEERSREPEFKHGEATFTLECKDAAAKIPRGAERTFWDAFVEHASRQVLQSERAGRTLGEADESIWRLTPYREARVWLLTRAAHR